MGVTVERGEGFSSECFFFCRCTRAFEIPIPVSVGC
jgi:hypothetical protein